MKKFLPALVWALIILFLSTMPAVQLPETPLLSPDKFAHAFVYGVLVILILYGLKRAAIFSKKKYLARRFG